MDQFYPAFETVVVQPGAAERIAKKIQETKELREKRKCTSCTYFNNMSHVGYQTCSHACNFAHDSFKPIKKYF